MKKILRLFGIGSGIRDDIPVGLRGSGVTGGKGILDKFFNQALYETQIDHVINTETKVKETDPTEGTAYVDLTDGIIRDKDDVAVTILDGDRIHWVEWETLTADIDLSAVDDIVHSTESGEILDLLTLNLLLGTGHSGFINATSSPTDETEGNISAVDSPELVVNNNRTEKLTDFEAKNLILAVASSTTGTSTADSIRLLDDNNNGFLIKDFNETFDITTDLNAGTEKSSTWYQRWIACDFLGNIQRLYVPDIKGTTDGTTAGFLDDSTNTAATDKVQAGDIIFNETTAQKTTVTTTPTVDGNDIEVDDDIFTSGDDYKIRILSPQFDSGKVFKGRIGEDFNNSSSDLEFSLKVGDEYAIIADEKTSGTAGGTFNNALWRTRDLNTLVTNIAGCSLSSNQLTLPAGDYLMNSGSIAFQVNAHKAKLYNGTDSSDVIIGFSAHAGAADSTATEGRVMGRFSISEPKAFEIRHICQTTNTGDGFGIITTGDTGEVEVYTMGVITKV